MQLPEAFYEPDGDGFRPTELTRGPWSPNAQHGGPPSALLGRAIERLDGGETFVVSRITLEILRPVPLARLEVEASIQRPGRSVQLAVATLRSDGNEIMRATAWRIRVQPDVLREAVGAVAPPPAGPESGSDEPFFENVASVGYHSAMQVRFIQGGFLQLGPAVAWLRMGAPLVPGEAPSPLVRVLVAADSGNGISSALDSRRYLFINTELSVHLTRLPIGEWIGMDASTRLETHGIGLTRSSLFDRGGLFGDARQSLFVAARETTR